MSLTVIIDYGMGNLRSVANAIEAIGGTPLVARDPADLERADRIILPGVGAFPDGMRNLVGGGWVEPLRDAVGVRRLPFLGICLGMQLLATTGTEGEICDGLGLVPGRVERLSGGAAGVRVPHIGWNDVHFDETSTIYSAQASPRSFYFVHSYVFRPDDERVVNGWCDYGERFAASIAIDNIHATQFHPEKSQKSGLALLRSFLEAGEPVRESASRGVRADEPRPGSVASRSVRAGSAAREAERDARRSFAPWLAGSSERERSFRDPGAPE